MIQRIRRPDGTRADIDHGPGLYGDDDIRLLHESRFAQRGAVMVADSPDRKPPRKDAQR